ncbi:uncharacterized protein LOC128963373 [Oppia nitens]|uniref:uncharacterized protein LOC128963373 n=1 Tax=Oppia nitens TaxID=1686743 RepID=UPI0023DAC0EA|nr:uncharacterized protein LOC128963373 [Oppia nitens]
MIIDDYTMNSNPETDINKVLNFWFGCKSDKDYLQPKCFWYASSPSDDQLVSQHLAKYYELATNGQLDNWINFGSDGALALILLLDQTPRNIYRNRPEAFMTDSMALSVAKRAVENG